MKALLSLCTGGPETLELRDVPVPFVGPGQLLVRVKCCAINYPDVLIIKDKYQFRPERPFAPGAEIAGIVEQIGEGVQGWSEGDRLIAFIRHGGLAEMALVDEAAAVHLPADHSFEQGSALLLTYATAIHGLIDRGRLVRGNRLLVLGAAGGVGLAAVELGNAFGAKVIAAVSSEEKAKVAAEAGADDVLVYPADDSSSPKTRLAKLFKGAVGPAGADIVFDPVGGSYAEPALRSLGWGGRYLVVGFPAGIPKLPLNLPLLKGCDVSGVYWGGFMRRDAAANAAHIESLFRLWRNGQISPKVSAVVPLDEASEAIARLEARQAIGKIVVKIG